MFENFDAVLLSQVHRMHVGLCCDGAVPSMGVRNART